MQALASHTLHACPSCCLGALPARRCHLAAALSRPAARRTQRARTLCTHAFGGVAAWPGSYEPSGLASAVGLGLAGLLALWVTLEDQKAARDDAPECATCGGTGLEDCACRRWSDGDVGCSTCHGSGKSACRSCHGGGTAVPIAAKAVKRPYSSFDASTRT